MRIYEWFSIIVDNVIIVIEIGFVFEFINFCVVFISIQFFRGKELWVVYVFIKEVVIIGVVIYFMMFFWKFFVWLLQEL